MIHSVSSTSANQPVASPAGQSSKPTQQAKPKSSESSDTVQLSSAAQAALKELTETSAQTAKEAGSGDRQAQRLLAKQATAKLENEPSAAVQPKIK